jgi:hypothetical protein
MYQIPTVLRSDEFRELIRTDCDFSQIRHKTTLKKEQRITDGMTQLMMNIISKWEKHSDFPFWNWVKFSREFKRSVCLNDISYFEEVLVKNGFQIDENYQRPINGVGGKTKAIAVPADKVECAIDYLKGKHQQEEHQNSELIVDWSAPFDFKGVPIPSRIKINLDLMKDVSDKILERSEKLYHDWNLQLRMASALETNGWLEQDYKISEFGRCFGTGLSSLQTMPKVLLNRILKGCWNLDVNTASLVILLEEHRRRYKSSRFNAIERFVEWKTLIREEVARSIGASVDSVKQGFTAIGFGMRKNFKPYYDLNGNLVAPTLTETFHGNVEMAYQFLQHPEVKEFWREMKILFDELSRGLEQELPDYKKSQRVAYLFQQGEAEVLRSICRCVGENLVLPKHDAVVVRGSMDEVGIRRIQDKVQQETGFKISLSMETL